MLESLIITGASGFLANSLIASIPCHNLYLVTSNPSQFPGVQTYPSLSHLASLGILARSSQTLLIHTAFPNSSYCQLYESQLLNDILIFSQELSILSRQTSLTVINLSSIHVYGPNLRGMIDESNPLKPATSYGRLKAFTESVFSELPDLILINLRLSNVFGLPPHTEHQSNLLFLQDCCRNVFSTGLIHIKSNPSLTRDFLPIPTFVSTIQSLLSQPCFSCGTFNLTSGYSTSLMSAAKLVQQLAKDEFSITVNLLHSEPQPTSSYTFSNEMISRQLCLPDFDLSLLELEIINLLKYYREQN